MDDKLIELRDAINEYLRVKKFYTNLCQTGDVKILINGATSGYKINGPLPEDYSLTNAYNIEQIQTMLEDLITKAKEHVYQSMYDCNIFSVNA